MPTPENVSWADDEYWGKRRLSPAQIQIFDVRLRGWHGGQESTSSRVMLEINETLPSSLVSVLKDRDRLAETLNVNLVTENRREQNHWQRLLNEYGWMNCLRSNGVQSSADDSQDLRKLRWIHIPSKFTEYLEGLLLAFSDWTQDQDSCTESLRLLEQCVYSHERSSKHGRYFEPFVEPLFDPVSKTTGPLLISVPFLDWSTQDPPPLRLQIDRQEGYQSTRSTSHLLRSLLQHFYRLEDTTDRELHQVFAKHKPWLTDRDLDLKVRRWYGAYPNALNVDELWILVIDERHIVTFASNQTWKSLWPPLQWPWRVAEISFRGIRNLVLNSGEPTEYSAYTHVTACLSGALGLLHRSFWTDITLSLTDRFASHLGHLQYRLHRAASTKLVMDLLQVQEELNIIIGIMQAQIDLLTTIDPLLKSCGCQATDAAPMHDQSPDKLRRHASPLLEPALQATYRQYSSSALKDPGLQLLQNLKREFADLCELRDNSNNLLNRTIQLVNIRLEDHGKAILVFTIVTIIFLPLSFVSSFFGMNTVDIRTMSADQSVFWIVSSCLTIGVVALAIFLAFYGGTIVESFFNWKASHSQPRRKTPKQSTHKPTQGSAAKSFRVLDVQTTKRF